MGLLKTIKNLFASSKKKEEKTAGTTSQSSPASGRTVVVGKSLVKLPAATDTKTDTKSRKSGTTESKSGSTGQKSGTGSTKTDNTAEKKSTGTRNNGTSSDGTKVAVGKTSVTLPKTGETKKTETSLSSAWQNHKEKMQQKQLEGIQKQKERQQAGPVTEGNSIAAIVNRGLQGFNEKQQEKNAAEKAEKQQEYQLEMLYGAVQTYEKQLTALKNKAERDPESITQADVDQYNTWWEQYQTVIGNYNNVVEKIQTKQAQKEQDQQKIRAALGLDAGIVDAPQAGNQSVFDIDPQKYAQDVEKTNEGASVAAQQLRAQLPKTLAAIGTAGVASAQDALANAMGMGENIVWALSPGAQKDAASAADHAKQVQAWKAEQQNAKDKMQKAFELTEDDQLGQFLVELNYNFVQQGAAMVAGGAIGKAGGTALRAAGGAYKAAGANMAGKIGSQAAQRAAAAADLSGKALQGAAKYLQKNAGLATMATLAGSTNYQAAIEGGASNEQAMAYAVLTAAAETVTEKLFGGNPLMDNESGLVNRALYKMLGDRKFLKALDSMPVEVFNEGFEEVIANYLYSGAQAVTGQKVELPTARENLHSFALGAAMGGIGQATKAASGTVNQALEDREIGKKLQEMGAADELIATGLELPGSRAQMRAKELQMKGSLPTARELGRQYRENVAAQKLLTARQMDTERTVRQMAQDVGAQVVFDDTIADAAGKENAANGYYQSGVLHISRDADRPAIVVAKHELTHYLQQAAPEGYNAFRAYAMSLQGENAVQEMQERYARGGVTLSEEEAMDEIAADFTEQLLTDSESIKQLINTNPTLADRFFAALREFLQKLTGRVDPKLKKAEQLWTEAYKAAQGNKNTAREGGGEKQYSFKTGEYDYKTLTEKPDMALTEVDDTVQYNTDSKSKKNIVNEAKKNAAIIGRTNENGGVEVYVDDIGVNVVLSTDGLKHGLDRRTQLLAPVTVNAGQILKNAIRINELIPRKDTIDNTYALLGAAQGKSGDVYIVEFVVNRFDNTVASMDVLYSVNTKKESAALNAPRLTVNPLSVTDSKISIAQLLDIARDNFPDILPESVLRHYGFDRRPEGKLGESALYSLKRDSADLKSMREERKQVREQMRTKLETYTGKQIREKTERDNAELRDLKAAWEMKRRTEGDAEDLRMVLALSDKDVELAQMAARHGLSSVNWETAAEAPADARRYAAALLNAETANQTIRAHFAKRAEAMQEEAAAAAKDMMEYAKDKRSGFSYQRETMERNIRDIFGAKNKDAANQIIQTYITPVHKAVAEGNRLKNEYRSRVKNLHLSKHESALVQMMLENESMAASEYAENNHINVTPELQKKLENAVYVFRDIYNELYEQINNTLIRNGQEPAPFRKNYAPHFTIDKPDTLLGRIRFALGLGKDSSLELPTDIAGITDQFRPGKKWFGNLLQRKGEITDYDAVHGFDQYVETAADVITLTDSIQKLRALEDEVRYTFSDEGVQKQIDQIREDRTMDPLQKRQKMEEIYKPEDDRDNKQELIDDVRNRKRMGMAKFVTELRRYTDNLAGKKAREDRGLEDLLNRQVYHIAKKLEGRVAANMIAMNPGSWLTNLIPITQATGEVSTANLLRGMRDTVRAMAKDDGFRDASTFLTNRYGSESIDKTLTDTASGIAGAPMEIIDHFTANVIARARYQQNISKGMSAETAMNDADDFTARLMADRSKGALPTIFNAKNPARKVFTMFQVEVNNQLSYLFKDMPKAQAEKGAAAVALAFTKVFVGAYLYNLLYKELTGRDAALDPIGIIVDALGIGDDEERTAKDVAETLAGGVAKNLPFVGGLLDGGRVPISAALPSAETIWNSINSDAAPEKKKQTIQKEMLKPLVYLVPPFGGGAVKKAVEGAATVNAGGSYTYDKDGNKKLQFASYDKTPLNYAQAMLFGKWSSKAAQEYVDNGFKGLSVAETTAFDTLRNEKGVDAREAMAAVLALRDVEADKDENGDTVSGSLRKKKTDLIDSTGWDDAAKAVLYFNDGDCASETVLKNRDDLIQKGVGQEQYFRYLAGTKDVEAEKDENGDTIDGSTARQKAEWLQGSGWSEEAQAAIYFEDAASDSKIEHRDALAGQGVSQAEYYRYLTEAATVEPDYDENGKTVNGSKNKKLFELIDGMDLTEDQKTAIYLSDVNKLEDDNGNAKYTEAVDAGISLYDYVKFTAETGAMANVKDGSGNTVKAKRDQVLDYINRMNISSAQKDILYYDAGYKESTISDAPWRGGSVKTGSAGSKKAATAAKKAAARAAAANSPAVQKLLSRGGYVTASLPKAGEPARTGTLPKAGEMDAIQRLLSRGGYADGTDAVQRYLEKYGG